MATTVFSDDFDGEVSGTAPDNWTRDGTNITATIYNTFSNSSPNSMRLTTNIGASYIHRNTSGGYDSDFSCSIKFGYNNRPVYLVLTDVIGSYSIGNAVVFIQFDSSGNITYYDGSSYQDTGTNYTVGAFHDIDIELDCTNNTFTLSYDSAVLVSDIAFLKAADSIKGTHFGGSANTDFLVDDVVLQSDLAPALVSDAIEVKTKLIWTDGTNTKTLNIKSFTHDRKMNSAAELTFDISNKSGEFNFFFMPGDEIQFYYGKGHLPDEPNFIGYPTNVTGSTVKHVTCIDFLGLMKQDDVKIDEYSNLDGMEASAAISKLITDTDGNELTVAKSGTNPVVYITEADKIREKNYKDRLSLISKINGICFDTTYSSTYSYHPLPYFFYVEGRTFYHMKQPYVDNTEASLTVAYADKLLTSEPEYTTDYLCNKCTYLGKEYEDDNGIKTRYEGSHTDASHKDMQRLFHVVKEDDTLESDGACKAEAVRYVQQNRSIVVRNGIKHTDGFDLIPGKSVIEITDSRYGLNGKHLLVGITVTGAQSEFEANFELSQRKSVMTDFV